MHQDFQVIGILLTKKYQIFTTFFFGFFFSLFLYIFLFQHQIFISKKSILASILIGFGLAIIFYHKNRNLEKKGVPKIFHIREKGVISIALAFVFIFIVGLRSNHLFRPSVNITIEFSGVNDTKSPKTILTSVYDNEHFISFKGENITFSDNITRSDRGLIIDFSQDNKAYISLKTSTWSDRLYFNFEDIGLNLHIKFTLNGETESFYYKINKNNENKFTTSLEVPPYRFRRLLSITSVFLSVAFPLFFIKINSDLFAIKKNIHKGWLLFLFFFIFILIFVISYYYKFCPKFSLPNIDSAMFQFYGKEILKGKILYEDLWDNKGPLLFFINAIGQKFEIGSWGVWIIEVIFIVSTISLLSKIFFRRSGYLIAGIIVTIFLKNLLARFQGGNFTEEYGIFFYVLAFYLFWIYLGNQKQRKILFYVGISIGLGVMLRISLISPLVAIGLYILLEGIFTKRIFDSIKSILFIISGFFSIILLFCTYFAIKGSLYDFIDAVFFYNFFYAQQSGQDIIKSISLVINRYPIYMFFILGLFSIVTGLVLSNDKTFNKKENTFLKTAAIGFAIELILYNLSGKNFDHYMVTLLPYDTIFLFFFGIYFRRKISNYHFIDYFKRVPEIFFFFMLIIGLIGNLIIQYTKVVKLDKTIYEELESKIDQDNLLVMWGYGLDFHNQLDIKSPSRFYNHIHFTACEYLSKEMINELIYDIEQNKPVIVDTMRFGPDYYLDVNDRKNDYCDELTAFFSYIDNNYIIVDKLANRYPILKASSTLSN